MGWNDSDSQIIQGPILFRDAEIPYFRVDHMYSTDSSKATGKV